MLLTGNSANELQWTSALPYKYFNRGLHPSNTLQGKLLTESLPIYLYSVVMSLCENLNTEKEQSCWTELMPKPNAGLCVSQVNVIPVLTPASSLHLSCAQGDRATLQQCPFQRALPVSFPCRIRTSHLNRFPRKGKVAEPEIPLLSLHSEVGDTVPPGALLHSSHTTWCQWESQLRQVSLVYWDAPTLLC